MKHLQLEVHYGDDLKLICLDCGDSERVEMMDCIQSDVFMTLHANYCDVVTHGFEFIQVARVKVNEE